MAIKFLINGFFRSGTTFLFNQVKEQLPENTCFYEPCYPKLGLVVEHHKQSEQKTDRLHGSSLWSEYAELLDSDFINLLRNHPNTKNNGIANDASLFKYLDLFNNLDKSLVLQTNRYHMYLGAIQAKYAIPVVHIIRNPIDVYFSMIKSYSKRSVGIKKYIRKVIFPFTSKNYFGQESELKFNIEKLGLPTVFYDNWRFRYFKKISFKETVYINWVLGNYAALTSKDTILIVFYENLIAQTEIESKRISKHINSNIDIENVKLPQNTYNKSFEIEYFNSIIDKYKLKRCLDIIQVEMQAQKINYF